MLGRPMGGRGELGLPVLRIGMLGGAATMMEGRGPAEGAAGVGIGLAGEGVASARLGTATGFAGATFSSAALRGPGFAVAIGFASAGFEGDLATGALLLVTGEMVALLVESLAGFRLGSATFGLSASFSVASWFLPEGCFAGLALAGRDLTGGAFVLTLTGCLALAGAEVPATGLPPASAFPADRLLAIGFAAATLALATALDAGFAPTAVAGADLGAGFAAGFGAGLAVAFARVGLLRGECAMGRSAPACQRGPKGRRMRRPTATLKQRDQHLLLHGLAQKQE